MDDVKRAVAKCKSRVLLTLLARQNSWYIYMYQVSGLSSVLSACTFHKAVICYFLSTIKPFTTTTYSGENWVLGEIPQEELINKT